MDIDKIINGIKLGLTVGQAVGLPLTGYALILVNLLDQIHAQGGKTPDELAKEIDATLDMNELRILANLERLKNVPLPADVADPDPLPEVGHFRSVAELELKITELEAKFEAAPPEKKPAIAARLAAKRLELEAARERG